MAEKQIDSLFSRYTSSTPGVAVAVVKDGKIVLQKGYGTANLEYGIPITPKTVFHIASVSKQFTAFSIYLLEKQGKLSFEDDIRKYIPELPDYAQPVKIKHLLAHTSGIKDQFALLTLAGWRMDDVITTEQILKMVSRQTTLNFEPGSQFGYSNSGYTLLAEVVKRITGKPFPQFAKEAIFDPLGMTNTRFYDDFGKIVKNRAYGYEIENGLYKKVHLNYSHAGATSLLTTVEDLAKWTLNFEKPVIGDAALITKFNQPSLLNNGQPVIYSIINGDTGYHAKGQVVRNIGLNLYNHGGHDQGFRSWLGRFPGQHLSIITLSNDEHYEILRTGLIISGFYLRKDLTNKLPENTAANASQKSADILNNNLKEFEGRFYNAELNTDYSAGIKEGKLFLFHTRLSDIALTETGKDKFSGRIEFPVEIEFVRGNNNNAVTGFRVSNFGAKNVLFEKMRL